MPPQRPPHRLRARPSPTNQWDSFQAVLGVAYTMQQELESLRKDTAAALDALASRLPDATVQDGFPASLARIVASAQNMTEASGAAIALGTEQEMTCVARSGKLAPPLGSSFNSQSGLSGECIRTREDVICMNTAADPRVDYGAANALGVKSMVYVPLISTNDKLIGVLAVFSSQPLHFAHRDLPTLRWTQYLVAEALKGSQGAQIGVSTLVPEVPKESEPEPAASDLRTEPVATEVELPKIELDPVAKPVQPLADLELAPEIRDSGSRVPLIVALVMICMFLAGVGVMSYTKYRQQQATASAPIAAVAPPVIPAAAKPEPVPEFTPEPVSGLPDAVRMKTESGRVLTSIQVPQGVTYEGFAIYGPNRVYFDLYGISLSPMGASAQVSSDIVSRVRVSEFKSGVTRVVFDLKTDVAFQSKIALEANSLSIDLRKADPTDSDAIVLHPGSSMKIVSTVNAPSKTL